MERLVSVLVDEGKWPAAALGLAFLAVAALLHRHRHAGQPLRRRVLAGMSLCFGVTIGTLAFGHLLAVSIKLVMGTLGGRAGLLYLIGIALAVPSWWLVRHSRAMLATGPGQGRATIGLNLWLVVTLLALGISNFPLAVPGLLNIAYHRHTRPVAGWLIVGIAAALNAGLFLGSLVFLASGQSFEQFRGVR